MVAIEKGKHDDASDVEEQEAFLQEALEETFPASDPIAPGHPHHLRDVPPQGDSAGGSSAVDPKFNR